MRCLRVRNSPMIRLVAILALCLSVISECHAQYVIVTPRPSSSAFLDVVIANTGNSTIAVPEMIAEPMFFVQTTMSATSPCVLTQATYWIRLSTPSLAAGESVACRLTYTRNAAAPIPTTSFQFRGTNGNLNLTMSPSFWVVGSVSDLSLRVSPEPPLPAIGATEAIFRVTVSNPSDAVVDGAYFGSCADFSPPQFVVDASLPGGCPTSKFGMLCFSSSAYEFGLPQIPANSESSCLVRASKASGLLAGDGSVGSLETFFAFTDAGYYLADPTYENGDFALVIAFAQNTPIPALRHWALWAIFILICWSVWIRRSTIRNHR